MREACRNGRGLTRHRVAGYHGVWYRAARDCQGLVDAERLNTPLAAPVNINYNIVINDLASPPG
jgi:hypothetical protein